MSDILELMNPVIASGRIIYPVVRVRSQIWPCGGMIAADPVALIINEGTGWFFVALEEGYDAENILARMDDCSPNSKNEPDDRT